MAIFPTNVEVDAFNDKVMETLTKTSGEKIWEIEAEDTEMDHASARFFIILQKFIIKRFKSIFWNIGKETPAISRAQMASNKFANSHLC